MEYSSCGVGFLASLKNVSSFENLQTGLTGLLNVEHRGGASIDGNMGDGAGIMTDIPFELLGHKKNEIGVATIFAPRDNEIYERSIEVFKQTFEFFGLKILEIRKVPINVESIDQRSIEVMPNIVHAIIKRPEHSRTVASFDKSLYEAKQLVRTKQKEAGIKGKFFFTSLSARTIIYKALCTGKQLSEFYLDLKDPKFKTSFVLFHRRFSTNTLSSWDKVQPFRLIAHNGEINTIEGNRSAAISREKSLGLRDDELITHFDASDSGNLNGMVEALKYRSSIPHLAEILSIMIPPAPNLQSDYYDFWSRAMEPWDGPALVAFCDGKRIGARLDRNGFRPCRWSRTKDCFYLASETGCFEVDNKCIVEQGSLYAGRSVHIHLLSSKIDFQNPDKTIYYKNAKFDARLIKLEYINFDPIKRYRNNIHYFYYSRETFSKELYPMVENETSPIGSMGDTARIPAISTIDRSLYDYFYQNFAQVTNPPLDYIREKMVTELRVYLGRKPNIFGTKELIPPPEAYEATSPVLSLGQLDFILQNDGESNKTSLKVKKIGILFDKESGSRGCKKRIYEIVEEAILAVRNGYNVIVLSDRDVSHSLLPIPAIIVMRAVQLGLNRSGLRLRLSIVIDSGEIYNSHQLACLIGFGASAVCPYLALEIARYDDISSVQDQFPEEREKRLIKNLENGLLRIMAKRGISVVRSYQGAELFTIVGLDQQMLQAFFPGHKSYVGGLSFKQMVQKIIGRSEAIPGTVHNDYVYRESNKEGEGELHSITSKRSRILHNILKESDKTDWAEFHKELSENVIHIRHFFKVKKNEKEQKISETRKSILSRFGCGAMSFGAISAEAQRDLIKAFKQIGGRSNSGEGGENPYYYIDGTSANVKQIASGRFGVTAEYLANAQEVQIKIAQGAKPGEGGQLMGVKVTQGIAKARFATPGVDLISPPPQHDIYSIEDLKELIYELKQFKPDLEVSVKLVSGDNIGAIAVGVVKAGADIIQISGGDGGTGAADLMSMKHAGLPLEIGLVEVQKTLVENDLRKYVKLRVDGNLQNARDIILTTIMGADQFDFGKIALVSQGCIMARVCEKNTCPAGIATHNPRFKERYKGTVEGIVKYFEHLADETINFLKLISFNTLDEIRGKLSLLEVDEKYKKFVKEKNLHFHYFNTGEYSCPRSEFNPSQLNELNQKILSKFLENPSLNNLGSFQIHSTQRAVPSVIYGHLASKVIEKRSNLEDRSEDIKNEFQYNIHLKGNAGQGFGVFHSEGVRLTLEGDANDSVAKGMSGGEIIVIPESSNSSLQMGNVLVGNICLYGATGGKLFIKGMAADRFAVRNSGAIAVVEGVGLHACEYMTGGTVLILGRALENIGAGMTGGSIYTFKNNIKNINKNYIKHSPMTHSDWKVFREIIQEHIEKTDSIIAKNLDELDIIKLTTVK
ncbi:MAG: glutamate synthase large subunit [Halobacteriovoraceae bacterium]|nr:glutamate synthase large subunit [Halobacteriovoraceae bacterium]